MASSMSDPAVTVILSTYNNMAALVRSLHGYEVQTRSDFEIVLADDGTSPDQLALLEDYLSGSPLKVRLVWHEDRGYRRSTALNRGIAAARTPLLILSDADIIPRMDFIESHLALSEPGSFVGGGSHLDLPDELVQQLSPEEILTNRCFEVEWLKAKGVLNRKLQDRLGTPPWLVPVKDFFTPRRNAFNGSNTSFWKEDAIRVNGFDEDWGYGGQDRDFGCRLMNAGVKCSRRRYSLVCIHQTHPRPYRDPEAVAANKARLRSRCRSKLTWVEKGLDQHLDGGASE
jgi:glycosyltransferase involved in cell wall biosynthesis